LDFSTIIQKDEQCLHYLEINATDNLGNSIFGTYSEVINYTLYVDNTPPEIVSYNVSADYYEDGHAKNVTGGCFNITVTVNPTGCCPNETVSVQLLVTVPSPEFQEGYEDVLVDMIQLGTSNTYYFNWCNGPITDLQCNNVYNNMTLYPGTYNFDIIVKDCVGNQNITSDYFLVKPMCDVDIIELIEPDPNVWHTETPTTVKALIKNNGILPVEGPINTHLQIYEETIVPLYNYSCFDMESCIVSGMWETISWDDGPSFDTWTWTEKRSHSATHSWHSQPDSLDVYEGNSRDSLILSNDSHGILIPESIEGMDNTYQVFVDFWHWCEGEAYGGNPLDYGQLTVRYWDDTTSTWSDWEIAEDEDGNDLVFYDTGGEWEHVTVDITDIFGFDDEEHRDPTIMGKYIQVNWTWFADATNNFEG